VKSVFKFNRPGISQRAAAARSQTVWRWLVRPVHAGGKLQQRDALVQKGYYEKN